MFTLAMPQSLPRALRNVSAEITFVAKGRGQYGLVCNLYNHASRGQTGAFVVWPAGYHLPAK